MWQNGGLALLSDLRQQLYLRIQESPADRFRVDFVNLDTLWNLVQKQNAASGDASSMLMQGEP